MSTKLIGKYSSDLQAQSSPFFKKPRTLNNRKCLHLAVCLLVSVICLKFISEFILHENMHKQRFHKTFKIRKHEINIIYNANHNLSLHHRTDNDIINIYNVEEEIIDFELVDNPSKDALLNITDFRWHRNNDSICRSTQLETKILPVLVHTSRTHFSERIAIRNTWGSLTNYKQFTVRPVFLMGEPSPTLPQDQRQNEEIKLDEESKMHGDIVTGTFVDAYRNLTYKHMMGYKWILEHCQNASFVLKTDDDMFIDVLYFIDKFVERTVEKPESAITPATDMFCYQFNQTKPLRCNGCKWYVSLEEWPEETYPYYCSGWAYAVSVDWISKMYLMSYQTKYFWVDDVFIGILLNMAKSFYNSDPKVVNLDSVYTFDNKLYLSMCNNTGTKELASASRKYRVVSYIDRNNDFDKNMHCLWDKILFDYSNNVTRPFQ